VAREATSQEFFATVHGAYLSGISTAHDVAATLGWRLDTGEMAAVDAILKGG
jgi:hypothetical protein